MAESFGNLEEVVVVGYAKRNEMASRDEADSPPPPPPPATFARETSGQTTRNYQLEKPLSLAADGQDYAVRLVAHPLKMDLRYRVAPKLDPTAYLEGVLRGWDTLGLTAAPMRVHLDGRYLGQDYLWAKSTADSLLIALGADDRILVEREALTQERDRKPLRGVIAYELGYRINLRNTLRRPVAVIVEDQIPVTRRDDIDISLETVNADPALDEKSGMLTWQLELQPSLPQRLEVRYQVKASRDVRVDFE